MKDGTVNSCVRAVASSALLQLRGLSRTQTRRATSDSITNIPRIRLLPLLTKVNSRGQPTLASKHVSANAAVPRAHQNPAIKCAHTLFRTGLQKNRPQDSMLA